MSEQYVLLNRKEKRFSGMLLQIPDCPKELFCVGNLKLLQEKNCVAIVGSRRATSYGLSQGQKISYDLARCGICIVSGLAIGIDGQAHRGALKVHGKTIAVLGTAIDNFYPHTHLGLAREILKQKGLIISEFGPKEPFFKQNFLLRNRIIAGLSRATIVVEAAEKSGALVTAGLALNYNRDVFALPGDVTRLNSAGTNNLIKEGAYCISGAKDVLDILGIKEGKLNLVDLSREEKEVFEIINSQKLEFDQILKELSLKPAQLNSTLLQLEIKGLIKSTDSGEYSKI